MSDETKSIDESSIDGNIVILDPEDYRQTRQLKQIHNAKEEYSKLKISEDSHKRIEYINRIQNLILELEPLMRRVDTEKNYLEEVEIGTIFKWEDGFEVEYSPDIPDIVDTEEEAIALAKQKNKAKSVDLRGVESLLGVNGYSTYVIKRNLVGRTNKNVLRSDFELFGRYTCDSAFRACREFIAEADLGLQVERDTGPAEI
jgi:hypothetical protein